MATKKRPKAQGVEGSFGLSDQAIARYREVAKYGDLIDEYFHLVNESLNSDDPIEVTTDDFLRYARSRRRQRRTGKAANWAVSENDLQP